MSLEATSIVEKFAAGLVPSAPPNPPPADSATAPASASEAGGATASPGTPPPQPPPGETETGTGTETSPSPEAEVTEEALVEAATEAGEQEPSAAKRVWQTYQGIKDLEKEEKEGGIGHIPTPDQIKSYYDQSITLNMMLNSLMSRGIGGLNTFFGMLENFAPGTEGQVYQEIPNLLKNLNDQTHYTTMKNFFVDEVLGELWNKASGAPEGEEKTGWVNLVSALYYFRNGKKFDPAQGLKAPENPEVTKLREERDRFQEATITQQAQGLTSQYMAELDGKLQERAGAALTPLRGQRSEAEFKMLCKTVVSAAVSEMTKSPAFMSVLNANFARVKPLLVQGKLVEAQALFNANREYSLSRIAPFIQRAAKPYLPTKPVVTKPAPVPAAAGTKPPATASAPAAPVPVAVGGSGTAARPFTPGDTVMAFLRAKGHAV